MRISYLLLVIPVLLAIVAHAGAQSCFANFTVQVVASDRLANDNLGSAVSVDDGLFAAAANLADVSSNTDAGAVYIYCQNCGGYMNWGFEKKITASTLLASERFGNSISISNAVIAVGAPTVLAGKTGSVYIFYRNQGGTSNWGFVKQVTGSDSANADRFGQSVSLYQSYLIVGAFGHNSFAGAAYLFGRDVGGSDNWGQIKKLTGSDTAVGNRFGISVSIGAGDCLAVGASLCTVSATANAGANYVFCKDQGGTDNWGQAAKLVSTAPLTSEQQGTSIAIWNGWVLSGAPLRSSSVGGVYIYSQASSWAQQQLLLAADATTTDNFGRSVAASGDCAVIGAPFHKALANNAGAAYLYCNNAGTWSLSSKIYHPTIGAGENFGTSVALRGTYMAVGSPQRDISPLLKPGFAFVSSSLLQCCNSGYYRNESLCTSCPAGTYSGTFGATTIAECIGCAVGYFSNTSAATTASTCIQCEPGSYANYTSSSTCTLCSPGTYSTATAATTHTQCVDCGVGTYNPQSGASAASACLTCEAGGYCNVGGMGDYVRCPVTTFNPNTGSSDSNACITCSLGHYCNSSGLNNPKVCDLGYFSNATGLSVCYACMPGYYCDNVTGTINPLACQAGTYNPQHASVSSAACLNCTAGFYCLGLGNVSPKECPLGTYNPLTGRVNITDCLTCPTGYYCNTTGASTLYACPAGTYNPISGATSHADCLICPFGHVCPGEGRNDSIECGIGYFNPHNASALNSDCQQCSAGTFCNSTAMTSPVACPLGTFSNSTSASFCYSCPAGTYCDQLNGTIDPVACPAGTFSPVAGAGDPGTCGPCPEGHYCPNIGMTAAFQCGIGTYNPNQGAQSALDCLDCWQGHYCNRTGLPTPVPCVIGTFSNTSGLTTCFNCPPGHYCDDAAGAVSPIACDSGTYNSQYNAPTIDSCLVCPGGSYCPSQATIEPIPCGFGSYSGNGALFCGQCDVGTYCNSTTTPRPQLCPNGTFANSTGQSACYACPPGAYCTTGASSPTLCLQGTYSAAIGAGLASVCQLCPNGSFANETGQTQCYQCNAGNYCGLGAITQTRCPVGTFNNATGGGFISDCLSCPNGTYSNATGRTVCIACDIGNYCGLGSVNPTRCPIGRFSNSTGVGSVDGCALCPNGTFNNVTGQTVCRSCGLGNYCVEGAVSPTKCPLGTYNDGATAAECQTCPAGARCPSTGLTQPIDCVAGTYSNEMGRTSCSPCPAGFFCSSSSMTEPSPCPSGTYSASTGAVSSTTCLSCPAGSYCNVTGAAIFSSCQPGTFSRQGAQNCTDCPTGFFCDAFGIADPLPCPSGTYNTAGSAATIDACTPCAMGSFSNATGVTTCNVCPAGHYCPSARLTAPVACAAGTANAQTGSSLVDDCIPCAMNSFSAAAASLACTPCPEGLEAPTTGAVVCVSPGLSMSMIMIIGGAGGGVVVVIVLIVVSVKVIRPWLERRRLEAEAMARAKPGAPAPTGKPIASAKQTPVKTAQTQPPTADAAAPSKSSAQPASVKPKSKPVKAALPSQSLSAQQLQQQLAYKFVLRIVDQMISQAVEQVEFPYQQPVEEPIPAEPLALTGINVELAPSEDSSVAMSEGVSEISIAGPVVHAAASAQVVRAVTPPKAAAADRDTSQLVDTVQPTQPSSIEPAPTKQQQRQPEPAVTEAVAIMSTAPTVLQPERPVTPPPPPQQQETSVRRSPTLVAEVDVDTPVRKSQPVMDTHQHVTAAQISKAVQPADAAPIVPEPVASLPEPIVSVAQAAADEVLSVASIPLVAPPVVAAVVSAAAEAPIAKLLPQQDQRTLTTVTESAPADNMIAATAAAPAKQPAPEHGQLKTDTVTQQAIAAAVPSVAEPVVAEPVAAAVTQISEPPVAVAPAAQPVVTAKPTLTAAVRQSQQPAAAVRETPKQAAVTASSALVLQDHVSVPDTTPRTPLSPDSSQLQSAVRIAESAPVVLPAAPAPAAQAAAAAVAAVTASASRAEYSGAMQRSAPSAAETEYTGTTQPVLPSAATTPLEYGVPVTETGAIDAPSAPVLAVPSAAETPLQPQYVTQPQLAAEYVEENIDLTIEEDAEAVPGVLDGPPKDNKSTVPVEIVTEPQSEPAASQPRAPAIAEPALPLPRPVNRMRLLVSSRRQSAEPSQSTPVEEQQRPSAMEAPPTHLPRLSVIEADPLLQYLLQPTPTPVKPEEHVSLPQPTPMPPVVQPPEVAVMESRRGSALGDAFSFLRRKPSHADDAQGSGPRESPFAVQPRLSVVSMPSPNIGVRTPQKSAPQRPDESIVLEIMSVDSPPQTAAASSPYLAVLSPASSPALQHRLSTASASTDSPLGSATPPLQDRRSSNYSAVVPRLSIASAADMPPLRRGPRPSMDLRPDELPAGQRRPSTMATDAPTGTTPSAQTSVSETHSSPRPSIFALPRGSIVSRERQPSVSSTLQPSDSIAPQLRRESLSPFAVSSNLAAPQTTPAVFSFRRASEISGSTGTDMEYGGSGAQSPRVDSLRQQQLLTFRRPSELQLSGDTGTSSLTAQRRESASPFAMSAVAAAPTTSPASFTFRRQSEVAPSVSSTEALRPSQQVAEYGSVGVSQRRESTAPFAMSATSAFGETAARRQSDVVSVALPATSFRPQQLTADTEYSGSATALRRTSMSPFVIQPPVVSGPASSGVVFRRQSDIGGSASPAPASSLSPALQPRQPEQATDVSASRRPSSFQLPPFTLPQPLPARRVSQAATGTEYTRQQRDSFALAPPQQQQAESALLGAPAAEGTSTRR